MRLFLSALVLVFSPLAFAGDGGYDVTTCTTDSGRTILSVYSDNYSGATTPTTVRLIIDGQMAEYYSANSYYNEESMQWEPVDPTAPLVEWNEDGFDVHQNELTVLNVKMNPTNTAKFKAVIKKGYKDPRVGTELEYYITPNAEITLSCTNYHQSP